MQRHHKASFDDSCSSVPQALQKHTGGIHIQQLLSYWLAEMPQESYQQGRGQSLRRVPKVNNCMTFGV